MFYPSAATAHRAIVFTFAALLSLGTAQAQSTTEPTGGGMGGGGGGGGVRPLTYNTTPGELSLRSRLGVDLGHSPLTHTSVEVDIAGFVAHVKVEQKFHNSSTEPVEAIYTFPLPDDAAVDAMTMHVGDRIITAEIKKRLEAQQIYQAARAAGQNAALLNQERPNIFTQSVANIMPGQDITVEISFVHLVKYNDGVYEWTFPTVVGPRYTGGSDGGPDPAAISPPIVPEGMRSGHDISIKVNLEAGVPLHEVKSVLHAVNYQSTGPTSAVIQLRDTDNIPNKDFTLRYAVAGDQVQSGVIALAPKDGESGFFTLILQPPAAPAATDIAPKEMIFVMDQSGSQRGLPIAKAKETAKYCLQHLNPNDTFQLVGFNTAVYSCFPGPVPATVDNVNKALTWLAPLEGNGGTSVYQAVDYALSIPEDTTRPRIVTIMTDGFVGNDAEVVQEVAAHRGNSRMFTFGIGNSFNRYLIDAMASEGRGEADYVSLNDDSQAIAQKFYRRIASPLLLNIGVDWGTLAVSDTLPQHIPDVFSAKPIIVTGRYAHGGQGIIKVSGVLRGKPWSEEVAVTLPDSAATANTDALRTIWARDKIDDLQIENWKARQAGEQPGVAERELEAAVTDISLKYHVMSQYTSMVAVEQHVVNIGGQQRTVDVPVEMADGTSYDGIYGVGLAGAQGRGGRGPTGGLAYSGVISGAGGGAGGRRGGAGGGGGFGGGGQGGGFGGAGGGRGGAGRAALIAGNETYTGATTIVGGQLQTSAAAPTDASLTKTGTGTLTLNANKDIALGTPAAKDRLAAMTPESRVATLRQVKLAATLQTLSATSKGPVEVQIWLNALPPDGLAKLKDAGFVLAATLTPDQLLVGIVDPAKLDDLLALDFVRLVEPPRYE